METELNLKYVQYFLTRIADCGYILRIENSGHRYYRTNNRWNYVVSNIDPTVYAEMCDVWEMDLFKSDLQLDQEWHNEQQMKKLLGVK